MSKIAIHTTALSNIESDRIKCIIYLLNILKDRGHDVCAFVDSLPAQLEFKFKVYSSESVEFESFDGALISSHVRTSRRVAVHRKASQKIYWAHGDSFKKVTVDSYKLENIHFMTTSHYVKIFLELLFKQKVLPHLVPGGVDQKVFFCDEKNHSEKQLNETCIFSMLDGQEPIRISIGLQAFDRLKRDYEDRVEMRLFGDVTQSEMYKAYGSSHFFVDPSLLAGLPLSPLEAMACGTIPIVTHFGTTDYIIDKQNGFFINANDVDDTYRIMKECTEMYFSSLDIKKQHKYENTRYGMISCVACLHANNWTWDRMADNFLKNLEEIEKRT